MLMPGRKYSIANTNYRYGFNGKEKDDKDGVVQYDYGFRIYDPRLGRFKSVDPLSKSYPWYTPYQFAGNKPIIAIDLDGLEDKIVTDKWAGITYSYFEFDLGAGLGLGLNYTSQKGFAYDEVGKTKYSAKLTLYVSNQIEDALSGKNPNFIAGGSVSGTINIQEDWKHETFLGATGAIAIGLPTGIPKIKSLKAADLVAINASIPTESVSVGIGLGYGLKIPVINTEFIQSISLTDAEVNHVQDLSGVWNELNADWEVKNIRPMRDENGNVTSYISDLYTKNDKGKEVTTGISLFSGVKSKEMDKDGKKMIISESDNIWRSENYQNQAIDAEQNGGTLQQQ